MKLAIVLVSLLGLSSHASADDGSAAARQHVAAARALHAQQRYPEALAELEAAYVLEPKPSLLFALGQLHVQLGRCERAIVFYRRFLASRPKPADAAVAREAIDVCKASPSRAVRPIAPIVTAPPPVALPSPPEEPRDHAPVASTVSHRTARYAGAALVVAGAGAAIGSLLLYRGAVADRDRADAAATLDEFERLTERSRGRYSGAVVSGVIGAAAITAGVIVFAVRRQDTVRVTASHRGGAVSWSTRF